MMLKSNNGNILNTEDKKYYFFSALFLNLQIKKNSYKLITTY